MSRCGISRGTTQFRCCAASIRFGSASARGTRSSSTSTTASSPTAPYAKTHEDWDLLLHLIAEGQRIVFVPAVLGWYYAEGLSMLKEPFDHSKMHRVYNQRGAGFPISFEEPKMYYPGVGFL